jgi:UTP--glucose-1-phosphate uridylyltransferase
MQLGSKGERARLFMGVNMGDFFHNMCDGFFLAAAFKGCGSSFGWRVATGTILHEIPQEFADYVILTGPRMGLSPLKALVCNFMSGLGVVVGAVIVLLADLENDAIGLLLAFGGGVYIHVGATECMPKMYSPELSPRARTAAMVAFIIGAVLIGLILLDHEHCVPPAKPGEEPVDPHAGHNH